MSQLSLNISFITDVISSLNISFELYLVYLQNRNL